MAEVVRHRWRIDAPWPAPSASETTRELTDSDTEELAALMLDAYRGTIDHDGEGIDDARDEVRGAFASVDPFPFSRVIDVDGHMVSACLAHLTDEGGFIGYVMTTADRKGQGWGRMVMTASLDAFGRAGVTTVTGWITDGNIASESLFRSLGGVIDDPAR